MSREPRNWLNTMTRIGDTDKRGPAWHYREGDTNHYPGAIPVEDVEALIVPFEPTRRELYTKSADGTFKLVPNFIGMAADNAPDELYKVHSGDYVVHPYKRWLIDEISRLIDGDLHISSAGLLAKGSVAWVELAISDVMTVEGFNYRPHLLGVTSANGRYETTYGRKCQATVCDNTLDIAYGEQGSSISYRHTAGSVPRLKDIAEAVGLILSGAVAFDEEMRALMDWKVPTRVFSRFLDEMVPDKGKEGELLHGAALTRVERKREDMAGMWNGDERVKPWNGTALGVLQLSNTWQHHKTRITKATGHQLERNMLNTIGGQTAQTDIHALGILKGLSESYGLFVPEKFERIEVPKLTTVR